MHILQIQDVCFDDEATRVMGGAFDRACSSIGHFARAGKVRELIASRIIEAAKNGERDPAQLHSEATMGFSIDSALVPIVSVARNVAVPVCASIACTA